MQDCLVHSRYILREAYLLVVNKIPCDYDCHCNVPFFGSVVHFELRHLEVAMRRMILNTDDMCCNLCMEIAKYLGNSQICAAV